MRLARLGRHPGKVDAWATSHRKAPEESTAVDSA